MKTGRNELCPCGSGIKFKRCCLAKEKEAQRNAPASAGTVQVSLKAEIDRIQQDAEAGVDRVKVLGVFVLFSVAGDAWLLEVTEMDAVRLAVAGAKQEVELEENPKTIEVNWTHKFSLDKKKFMVTAYADNTRETFGNYPFHEIQNACKKIRKRVSAEFLQNVHVGKP